MRLLLRPPPSSHAVAFAALLCASAACTEASPPAPLPPVTPAATATAESAAPAGSPPIALDTPAPSLSATATASAAAAAAPPVAAGPRIWGKSRFTWIAPTPSSAGAWVGYLGLGGSVQLKGGSVESARVATGNGCSAWYAIEPAGFVCAGDTASIDSSEEVTAALIRDAGKPGDPWPFEYGESLGAPRYTQIPTPAEMRKAEWDLESHIEKVNRARNAKTAEELAAIDKEFVGGDFAFSDQPPPKLPPISPFIRVERKVVVKGSTIAWTRAFDVEYPGGEMGLTKRTFVLTSDFAIIPKDRIRPYPRSPFKGVELGDSVKLPLAFFRRTPRPKYKKQPDGSMAPTGETWPAKAWTMITGEDLTVGKDRYLVTREEGIYAKAEDATVIDLAQPPSGKILEAKGRGTWLDVSVLGGWLVAYEKTRPVFVTLISPGRGGVPFPGIDPLATASTPLGNFRVDGKFVWATMVSSSNSDIVHTDVQYVQNFHGPHALHGAYWHNSFGEPKSGGCINLSPMDSKWVFDFTEPPLPEGWHGMRAVDYSAYATIVSVHR